MQFRSAVWEHHNLPVNSSNKKTICVSLCAFIVRANLDMSTETVQAVQLTAQPQRLPLTVLWISRRWPCKDTQ